MLIDGITLGFDVGPSDIEGDMEGRTVGSLDGEEEFGAMLLNGTSLGSVVGLSAIEGSMEGEIEGLYDELGVTGFSAEVFKTDPTDGVAVGSPTLAYWSW